MPLYGWPADLVKRIQGFESRHDAPESGALLSWAVSSVDALHYLVDLDGAYDADRSVATPHNPDVVDVAHARWATGTSMTALDLCAAALGRAFCASEGDWELALSMLRPGRPKYDDLPDLAQEWAGAIFDDPELGRIQLARRFLTHRRLPRHFYLSAGTPGPERRLDLQLGESRVPVGQLVVRSRDLAATHVSALVGLLAQL